MRTYVVMALVAAAALATPNGSSNAQQPQAKAKKAVAAKAQAPAGMKICNYKFPDGERRAWTCRKEEPCCAWDAIKYVKCGSTITNCF